jgi:hypothetical protein
MTCGCGSRIERGTCHLCKATTRVAYCSTCDHWFCVPCWDRWFARAVAAVKQFFAGRTPDCCGPEVRS